MKTTTKTRQLGKSACPFLSCLLESDKLQKSLNGILCSSSLHAARWWVLLKVGALFLICWTAAAQGTSPTTAPLPPAPGEDSDPTRPVIWSLREEYYNLPGQAWNNAFIFRIDRAVLKKRRWPVKNNGIVTRLDIPFLASHRAGGTNAGLGDIYAQAFVLPYRHNRFLAAAGSGISIPTATNRRSGTGKLTIAPVAAPLWLIPKRGFFLVKFQDYFSVAGAHDRPDLHYMTVTPQLVWRLKDKPYWIQLDGESQTNWKPGGQTGYKTGFLIGRITKRRGMWLKVEVGIGRYRIGSLAIKTSLFKVR